MSWFRAQPLYLLTQFQELSIILSKDMDYKKFIAFAVAEDSRNRFGKTTCVKGVPDALHGFYTNCNPIDVEINYPGLGALRFYGIDELKKLHSDYSLPSTHFVFATCNGDPVFLNNDVVYISLPGKYTPELLASSFEDFINNYTDK